MFPSLLFPILLLLAHFPHFQAYNVRVTSCAPTKPVYVRKGDTLSLNVTYDCSLDPSQNPNRIYLRWRKYVGGLAQEPIVNGGGVEPFGYHNSRISLRNLSLILTRVKYEDSGIYEMTLSHDEVTYGPIFEVIVYGPPLVYFQNENRASLDQKDFRVVCNVTGMAGSEYALYHNGTLMTSNISDDKIVYTIPVVKFHHAGNYTCTGRSDKYVTTKTLLLSVEDTFALELRGDRVVQLRKEKFSLTCHVTVYSTVTVSLYHNGTKVNKNFQKGVYDMYDVQFDDAGNYTCVAHSNSRVLSSSILLEVTASPGKVSFNNAKGSIHEGFPEFKIICVTNKDVYWTPTYTIYHDGSLLESNLGVYTIHEVNKKDAGNYTCVARNKYGVSSGTFHLNVTEAEIKITSPVSPVVLVEIGDNLLLSFTYRADLEHGLIVIWRFARYERLHRLLKAVSYGGSDNHMRYTYYDPRVAISNRANLVLERVTTNDAGLYEVQLESYSSTQKVVRRFKVFVQEKLEVYVQCNPQTTVDVNGTFACECKSTKRKPQASVQWWSSGKPMEQFSGIEIANLSIINIRPDQEGDYTCVAKSGDHEAKKTISVKVKCRPAVTFRNTDIVYLGAYFEIVCHVACLANPQYTLYHNGTTVTRNFTHGIYALSKVEYRDAGKYTCLAETESGVASNSFSVNVTDISAFITQSQNDQRREEDGRLVGKKCGKTWKSKWYLIFIAAICGIVAGLVVFLLTLKLLDWKAKGKREQEIEDVALVPCTNSGGADNNTSKV